MKRKIVWTIICLLAGGAVIPASYAALWLMRGRFIEGYRESRMDCQRSLSSTDLDSGRISEKTEQNAAQVLAESPELVANVPCNDFLKAVSAYRDAMPARCIGFGIVVAAALLLVRFVMLPMDSSPEWIERV